MINNNREYVLIKNGKTYFLCKFIKNDWYMPLYIGSPKNKWLKNTDLGDYALLNFKINEQDKILKTYTKQQFLKKFFDLLLQ